jgi:hypothetical protein
LALYALIHVPVVIRILIRPHREPASRLAWLLVILLMPVLGVVAYVLLGEVNIGHARVRKAEAAVARLARIAGGAGASGQALMPEVERRHGHLFRAAGSINGFQPHGGNTARLLEDSNASILSVVETSTAPPITSTSCSTSGSPTRTASALPRPSSAPPAAASPAARWSTASAPGTWCAPAPGGVWPRRG